jgi:hypothetical protein
MKNTFTAEWSETIKKENGYFVFRYLINGDAFKLKLLRTGKRHKQLVVDKDRLYFETWIYFGQEGILNYDDEADRYFVSSKFYRRILDLKKGFGSRLLSDLSIVTKDVNWLFSYQNEMKHFRNIPKRNEDEEHESSMEIKLKMKKRLNRVYKSLVLDCYRTVETPLTGLNTWFLACQIVEAIKNQVPLSFQIIKPLSSDLSEPFTGFVKDASGSIYEIEPGEVKLFFASLKENFQLRSKADWERGRLIFYNEEDF